MISKLRRKIKAWFIRRFAGEWFPFIAMTEEHVECCGYAGRRAVEKVDWTSVGFNRILDGYYEASGKRGCSLTGWQRRCMIYTFSMKEVECVRGCDVDTDKLDA